MTEYEEEPPESFAPVIAAQEPGDRFRLDFTTRDDETVTTVGNVRAVEGDQAMVIATDDGERYRIEAGDGPGGARLGLTLYRDDDGAWERLKLKRFARE
jgi:hypothetical protein